jgi:pimeloyl-ACP methyl ester carboxylesterase
LRYGDYNALHTFDIVFIPGLRPKPENPIYREALLQCISFGLRRYCAEEAGILDAAHDAFRIYSWTHDVYGEHRDIALDLAGIGALLAAPVPDAGERAVIESWSLRLTRVAHQIGDLVPLLGRMFASERQRMMMSEATDYLRDRGGVGSQTRAGLAEMLLGSWTEGSRLIVVGHSLGSVIAYDTLWELSQSSPLRVHRFITIGSPLGTRFVRRALLGAEKSGASRYPHNIRHWTNIAAKGELTALYPKLRDAYGEMLDLGLLEDFDEYIDVYNHFVGAGGLNVHSEYGYLIQPEFARALADSLI